VSVDGVHQHGQAGLVGLVDEALEVAAPKRSSTPK
jgi:hypothetical protein